MGTTPGGEEPRRRRRAPQEAERQIVVAAESLLRERPFRELTVDEVMRRTELSRPSFYVYFRDRHHLVLRVVEGIESQIATVADLWFQGEGDRREHLRAALAGIVEVFSAHGPVLRALADAAADDPEVEAAYAGFIRRFVEASARHIEAGIAAGEIASLDAWETARALVLRDDRYLISTLGYEERVVPEEQITETLATIWTRVLYGAPVPAAAASS